MQEARRYEIGYTANNPPDKTAIKIDVQRISDELTASCILEAALFPVGALPKDLVY